MASRYKECNQWGKGNENQNTIHAVPAWRPVAFDPIFFVLDDHLNKKNQGAHHVNALNPYIVDSAGLQVDHHRIQQNDNKNKFVVKK